ncbi:hypothetical protein GCM10010990_23350 [Croceicoccus mobilis]|uniref:Uncharacterized protein n=2 Tax=Croceicoccus mobilis TaxID=1703339 RepID=A0A916Z2G9_9SPHN|nr:hypothetical protein GCM10010990_23350 [Croceicoccus mobilis]
MDHYSTTFDEIIEHESQLWRDEASCAEDTASVDVHLAEPQTATFGAFRGMLIGVPVALALWAPILAAGYYLLG